MSLFYEIAVIEQEIKKTMMYNDVPVLNYVIKYPEFVSSKLEDILSEINLYYKEKALDFKKYIEETVFKMSLEQYELSYLLGHPIVIYEETITFTVTFNKDCGLSLFFDYYKFRGGTHGLTTRFSDSWNLETGKILKLGDLFSDGLDYESIVLTNIKELIQANIDRYYPGCGELIAENFNTENFYLKHLTLIIYFQLYEIAPFAAGIPTFELPFSTIKAFHPGCPV